MTTRTSSETVTFLHPFKLSGADDMQPAGRYLVETDEALLQNLSFPAYRRLSAVIHLAGRPGRIELTRVVPLDPAELSAVLAKDSQVRETTPQAHAAIEVSRMKRDAKEVAIEGWKHWLTLNATELKWTALVVGGAALVSLLSWSTGGVPRPL
jgi:hypothetical protein